MQSKRKVSPKCNSYLKDNTVDCPNCGCPHSSFEGSPTKGPKRDLTPPHQTTNSDKKPFIPPQKENKAQKIYWIILGGIAAIFIIVFLFSLISDSSYENPNYDNTYHNTEQYNSSSQLDGGISTNMTKSQVRQKFGSPISSNTYYNDGQTKKEQWLYRFGDDSELYVYFENGRVFATQSLN